jgi:hypothetical protein
MSHETDEGGVCVDTGLRVRRAAWSGDGAVLAVAGLQQSGYAAGGGGSGDAAAAADGGREAWLVQFYSAAGEHLRTLRVPAAAGGGGVAGLAWEGRGLGLRLALAVDSAVLFASVRREHLWGYFAGGTLVYAFVRADRPTEHCVVFWETRGNVRCGGFGWFVEW